MNPRKTLICTVGLPRSGKTTWARLDAIRLAVHGQRFWAPAEKRVWVDAHQMVRALFLAGHEWVIVDACHTTRKRRDFWLPESPEDWDLYFYLLFTSREECLAQARAIDDQEIIPVIESMAEVKMSTWQMLNTNDYSRLETPT